MSLFKKCHEMSYDYLTFKLRIVSFRSMKMQRDGRISVVIADAHPLIREGIKRLVEHASDMELVGEASDGQQAIELIQKKKPDIIILDLQMPVMDGMQVIDYLSEVRSTVIILVLSAQND